MTKFMEQEISLDSAGMPEMKSDAIGNNYYVTKAAPLPFSKKKRNISKKNVYYRDASCRIIEGFVNPEGCNKCKRTSPKKGWNETERW